VQVPAYLTCLTALPTETGIAFSTDAYGRDKLKRGRRSGQ
jgi:murein L,D-transpeptidase YcbB/YkuD